MSIFFNFKQERIDIYTFDINKNARSKSGIFIKEYGNIEIKFINKHFHSCNVPPIRDGSYSRSIFEVFAELNSKIIEIENSYKENFA